MVRIKFTRIRTISIFLKLERYRKYFFENVFETTEKFSYLHPRPSNKIYSLIAVNFIKKTVTISALIRRSTKLY